VGTLRGDMQDAVAHDSGALQVEPAGDHEDASQHVVRREPTMLRSRPAAETHGRFEVSIISDGSY
jgi:hypothetical protein